MLGECKKRKKKHTSERLAGQLLMQRFVLFLCNIDQDVRTKRGEHGDDEAAVC